ncbi:hypothetical protein COL77_30700 [Bacillus wiedmannii]|uniref:hypothetical protein n=1 Tax=Bacillus wiedmannii TaxID=1890302 RepID=UPI000BF329AC|nr:hypothetical protein [Bacillus wiedmannii]PFZ33468.1 hypothetical protein COL77_30700 [Bacillus wiedmannii]
MEKVNELKNIMDMEIKTKKDARIIVRYFNKQPEFLVDEKVKEKREIALSFLSTGVFTNFYFVTFIKEDSKIHGATGNCYKVYYKKELIGYVAQFQELWHVSESIQELLNSPFKNKMRKVAVDGFIQSKRKKE